MIGRPYHFIPPPADLSGISYYLQPLHLTEETTSTDNGLTIDTRYVPEEASLAFKRVM